MKKLIIPIIICGMIYIISTSCEQMFGDYLEKAPGVDVTEDTIFSSQSQMETFLISIYRYGIHSNHGYRNNGIPCNPEETLMSGASDESDICASWYFPNQWNAGTVTSNSNLNGSGTGNRWPYRWTAIRQISVFLDRVDDVPGLSEEYINQLKAEVRVIRALNYFEMLKHYGGVAIIDKRLQLNDEFKIPRSSVEDVVNFIVAECGESATSLPDAYSSNFRGRITKGAALAIKARTLLYAASPMFNTGTPYLDLGENNDLICFGNYDVSRWQDAADAAKAVLDWAPGGGIQLVNNQGVDKNNKYQWEVYDNPEIILAEKATGLRSRSGTPWSNISPPSIYPGSGGQSGISPTLNFVKLYEKKDGTPAFWDPSGGTDLQAKMAELDWRFHQTIAYNRSSWNWQFPIVQIHKGGRDEPTSKGFWLHKHYPEAISSTTNSSYIPNSTLYSLNEFYLNYAEALNEAQGPLQAAYDAVNTIRQRSGQPDLPLGLNQDLFRDRVRNERAIELAFDNHRFWDLRRWLLAEQVLNGPFYGIKIYTIPGVSPTEYRYAPYIFESRTFLKKHYLFPFFRSEVDKGYLIQNPGY